MKALLLLILFATPALRLSAQTPLVIKSTPDDVRRIASEIRSGIPETGPGPLVTDYTFHRSFSRDFSKIVSVDNAANGDVAYAALTLDKAGGTFNLAPLTFRKGDRWAQWLPYLNGNLHIIGKLGTDGTSTIFQSGDFTKEWQAGITLNFVARYRRFFVMNTPSHLEYHFDRYQHSFVDEVEQNYTGKASVNDQSRPSEVIGNAEILEDRRALEKAMWTAYSDLEEKMAKRIWRATYLQWVSLTADAGRTSRNIRNLPATDILEQKVPLFTGQVAYNGYFKWMRARCDHHVYVSIPFRMVYESTLTGVTPNTWNKITGVADSTFLIAEQKPVYVLNGTYNTGFSKAAGIQALYIAEWKSFAIGVNASLTYHYFFWDKGPGSRSSSYTQNYGLVFPLRDKDGLRAVNVEVFYSKKANTDGTSLGNAELWGLRFAIPVLSFK